MADYTNPDKKPTESPDNKKMKKVVTGQVVVRKPGISARFKNIFFGGDMDTAIQYVMMNVVFPAIRDVIADSVRSGVDQFIYGGDRRHRPPPRGSYSGYAPRVQYHNPSVRPEPRAYLPDRAPTERWQRNQKPFEQVLVASKTDADAVVDQMINAVDQYNVVSVADLCELLGQEIRHTDHKWGWTNLSNIEVRQTRDGYLISFPDIEEI